MIGRDPSLCIQFASYKKVYAGNLRFGLVRFGYIKITVFGSYGFRFHGFRFHGSYSVPIIINFFMCASEARDGGRAGRRAGPRSHPSKN